MYTVGKHKGEMSILVYSRIKCREIDPSLELEARRPKNYPLEENTV
uniref:Uncharacterized protein n=1 Tax=Rhizophora mucronata TaxID=61149 RepID=A0A2P2P8Z1_RHIMU